MARYRSGDRVGLDELHAVTRLCRAKDLLALPRAIQNLAYVMCEEGDWVQSDRLLTTVATIKPGVPALTTGYSIEAMRAYFDGDFGRLLTAADAFVDTPSGQWDMQVRGIRAFLRVLRDEPVPNERSLAGPVGTAERGPTPVGIGPVGGAGGRWAEAGTPPADDITEALDSTRRSGFRRMYWTMLSMGALCRALQDRRVEAAGLLDELATSWAEVPSLASGEWIAAAAFAAALTGRDTAVRVRGMLDRVGHRTPWAEAALHTVTAAVAAADGDRRRAGQLYIAAAEIYSQIPTVTDRMLALALAAGELTRAGDTSPAFSTGPAGGSPGGTEEPAGVRDEVRAFAARNQAPGLLRLAGELLGTTRQTRAG